MAGDKQPMKNEQTITFEVKGTSPFDLKAKKDLMQNVARSDEATQQAIINFLNLSSDDKERVGQLIKTPKALEGLKKHWAMLKGMFGVK